MKRAYRQQTEPLLGGSTVKGCVAFPFLGQEVFKTTPNVSNASIDLSTLKGGIYMVKVQVGNMTDTYKIIKK